MIKRQTMDEYIGKHFPYWKEASVVHLGRHIDPRQGGQFLIKQSESKKANDPDWYRQDFNCMSLDQYLSTAETIASLALHEKSLNPKEVVQILSDNGARVMRDRYDSPRDNPLFPTTSLMEQVRKEIEWQNERGIADPRKINRAIACSLLQNRSNIGDNSDIPILTNGHNSLSDLLVALRENSHFNGLYSIDVREGDRSNKVGLFIGKDGKISPHRIEKEQQFPDNRIDYRNGGADQIETLNIVKMIADVVRQNSHAAHFGLIYRPDTHGQEIHGAFYDPSWENAKP